MSITSDEFWELYPGLNAGETVKLSQGDAMSVVDLSLEKGVRLSDRALSVLSASVQGLSPEGYTIELRRYGGSIRHVFRRTDAEGYASRGFPNE